MANLVVPKRFRFNGPVGVASSIHVKDNSLYLVSSIDKGSGRSAIVATINVQEAKMNKIEQVKKTDIKGGHPADPQATLWFKDSFVISYLDADGVMLRIARMQANLQKFSY